jgi:hypothetical protein
MTSMESMGEILIELVVETCWPLACLPTLRNRYASYPSCLDTAATIMLSHGIPSVIVAGMLGHSISILLNTYAHFIPTMQDQAAQLMNDILTPVPIELRPISN